MKTLFKLVLLVVVIVIAWPFIKYRTINPCSMLKKERLEQVQEQIEDASESVQEAAEEHSEQASELLGEVGEALEGLAEGIVERAVEMEVDELSTRQCIAELFKGKRD